jgi:hypothetical protein
MENITKYIGIIILLSASYYVRTYLGKYFSFFRSPEKWSVGGILKRTLILILIYLLIFIIMSVLGYL